MTQCTQAEFARLQGVSRKTVSEWKTQGYIRMVGDRVDIEASNRTLSSVGRSRLDPVTLAPRTARKTGKGNTSPSPPPRVGNTVPIIGDRPWSEDLGHQHAREYPGALNLQSLAANASDTYLILRAHLAPAAARQVAEQLVARSRAVAVDLNVHPARMEDGQKAGDRLAMRRDAHSCE
jgi:hypothetical protein